MEELIPRAIACFIFTLICLFGSGTGIYELILEVRQNQYDRDNGLVIAYSVGILLMVVLSVVLGYFSILWIQILMS